MLFHLTRDEAEIGEGAMRRRMESVIRLIGHAMRTIFVLTRLFFALLSRKSKWIRTDIPTDPRTFSHDPYARLDLECDDGVVMCRVIDLIAALLKCDFYDCVIVGDVDNVTHCEYDVRIELISGIPLMDLCDVVTIIPVSHGAYAPNTQDKP